MPYYFFFNFLSFSSAFFIFCFLVLVSVTLPTFLPTFLIKFPTFLPAFTEGLFIVLEKFRLKVKYNFNENKKNNNENYYLYLIRNFSEALEHNNKEYIIFYSPESNELLNLQHKNNSIKKLLKNNLNNFYDLSEELKNYSMNDIFHDDIHLNKKGHKLYSDIMTAKILDFLKK